MPLAPSGIICSTDGAVVEVAGLAGIAMGERVALGPDAVGIASLLSSSWPGMGPGGSSPAVRSGYPYRSQVGQ